MASIVELTLTREGGTVLVNLDQMQHAKPLADGTTRITFDGGADGSNVVVVESLKQILALSNPRK